MDRANVMLIMRLALHIVGSVMSTLGLATKDQFDPIEQAVLATLGPLTNLGAIVWTALANRRSEKLKAVVKMPADEVAAAVIKMPEIKGIVATEEVADKVPNGLVVSTPQELPKKL